MSSSVQNIVLLCLASTWHLISANNRTDHTVKLTSIEHLCHLFFGKTKWDNATAAAKTEIDRPPFGTTNQERTIIENENPTNDQIKQERGLRAFNNMIKVGRAFDPPMDLWDDLEKDKDLSYIDDEDVSELRKWFQDRRAWHEKNVPNCVLEHLTKAYALYRLAGPISIAEQASVVIIAHLIWDESSWNECLDKTEGILPPRPSVGPGMHEGRMEQAMDVMRLAKGVLEQVNKDWVNALDWVEEQVGD
jgi:hypothetical protein